ncbi:MAG TPA: hypothetical protein VEI02_04395 [Planctomycetota bacterium]|nr:hypothetical protein [Planctomycetota bacterium]
MKLKNRETSNPIELRDLPRHFGLPTNGAPRLGDSVVVYADVDAEDDRNRLRGEVVAIAEGVFRVRALHALYPHARGPVAVRQNEEFDVYQSEIWVIWRQ